MSVTAFEFFHSAERCKRAAILSTMLFGGILIFSGCGTQYFLDELSISRLEFANIPFNQTIFYEKVIRFSSGSELYETSHRIIRVGADARLNPDLMQVLDGSTYRLTGFEARIIRSGKTIETYGKGDLASIALSSSKAISESHIRVIPIRVSLQEGDLLETADEHQTSLGMLGVVFSLGVDVGRARNVSCVFTIPATDTFRYVLLNDSLRPAFSSTAGMKSYRFFWSSYAPSESRPMFAKTNRSPTILAAARSGSEPNSFSWSHFGNWYLDLIRDKFLSSPELTALARELTHAAVTDRDKMDAIFSHCVRSMRYGQVYLERGEFIPNTASVIYTRKIGDCKDYSVLMYVLAVAAGLNPDLALCYRGRGHEIAGAIPVSQFNHMILHYTADGKDLWYDGTNRGGLPGVPSFDLANARALVLRRDASYLTTIDESGKNHLAIHGTFDPHGDDLVGSLSISFDQQYALEFFMKHEYLNRAGMQSELADWLTTNLNEAIVIRDIDSRIDDSSFSIQASCEFPNVITAIYPFAYTSISHIFPRLLPSPASPVDLADPYFCPWYNRVSVNLCLGSLIDAAIPESKDPGAAFGWETHYAFPAGPFTDEDRNEFVVAYKSALAEFAQQRKLKRREQP